MTFTHYDVLGVSRGATTAEIRAAWLRAVKWSHSDTGGSDAQTAVFNAAYDVLKDPRKRSAYDADLASGRAPRSDAERASDAGPAEEAWGADDHWEAPPRTTGSTSSDPESTSDATLIDQTDRSTLSWWSPTLGAGGTDVTPQFGRTLKRLRVAAVIWGIVLAIAVVLLARGHSFVTAALVLLMVVPALPARWRARASVLRPLEWAGYAGMVLVSVVGVVAISNTPRQPLVTAWSAAAVGGLWVVKALGDAWQRESELDRLVPRVTATVHNTFGRPGVGLFSAAATFGPGQEDSGQLGERLTARLLEPVLDLPGAKMVHGLPWPGSPVAEVDHAIVCGDRVALIDSVLWRPGRYSLDRYGAVLRDGHHFRGGDLHFAAAVEAWQQRLPRATIAGYVVAHADGRGVVTLTATSGGPLTFVPGRQACEQIGAFLAPAAGLVDRQLLARLLVHPDEHHLIPRV